MGIGLQAIQDVLPVLRGQYARRLRAQCKELHQFIARCERDHVPDDVSRDARMLAHSLSGTGTTFGFPEISDAARYLEMALDCDVTHDAQVFTNLSLKLISACEAAESAIVGQDGQASISSDPGPASDDEAIDRPRLLFVNADDNMIMVMKELFRAHMDLLCASNMADAADLVARTNPAVVIVDVRASNASVALGLEKLHAQVQARKSSIIVLAPSRRAATLAQSISRTIQCIMKPASYEKIYDAARGIVDRNRRVVLIGDDDAIVRDMMANRFRTHGFSVLNADDGAQVLDLAGRHHPSIIILDRIMPGLEGVAVLQMLKSNPVTHDIPVVMLTSKRRATDVTEARRAGVAEYIVKPFRPDHVVATCLQELGMMN